jgi:hypothetical protein
MPYDPTPATPTILTPLPNAALDTGTHSVTLSWSDAEAATPDHPVSYSVRVRDLTEPDASHPNNNCVDDKFYVCRDWLKNKSMPINVSSNHAYSWQVWKVVAFKYIVRINGKDTEFTTYVKSAVANSSFRVGECDAAEIVVVAVPEIIAPGATVTAYVGIRNLGSKTWTPEQHYRLGSLSLNDMRWGTNRAELNTASKILPGQYTTFTFSIKAPQSEGKYVFQWRMLLEGAYWFGEKSTLRYVKIGSPSTVDGNWLKRNLSSGFLESIAGDFTILRGGNYHVFEKNSQAQRSLKANGAVITRNYDGSLPCPPRNLPSSTLTTWGGEPWSDLFGALFQNGSNLSNLLRVFLRNGFGIAPPAQPGQSESPGELYPFNLTNNRIRKWQIKNAVDNDQWYQPYFDRLNSFAEQARLKRVFLQLSLFNYYELDKDAWGISIWNPDRSDDPDWGSKNLVNLDLAPPVDAPDEARRQSFFIEPPAASGLRKVQEKIVRKVVSTLRGQPNIILEVMNEPHGGSHQTSAQFASKVISWILDEGLNQKGKAPWRPLISVNAFRQGLDPHDPDKSDVDWWADPNTNPQGSTHIDNYEEIDIITYHGLTAYPTSVLPFKCGASSPMLYRPFYRVDRNSIHARRKAFRSRHPSKALMMSTDAVRLPHYTHPYGENTMDQSDGQITTNLNHAGKNEYDQLTRSDLNDWAFWCFERSFETNNDVIHFQNHSNFEATYQAIEDAYRASL